jgi:hypothetical protein
VPLGGFWRSSARLPFRPPLLGEEATEELGRERQCGSAPRVAFRQCAAQARVPDELPPGAQLVKPEVERNAAQDVDRLALLVMAEPEPINGPDHLGLAALLHDSLDAGSGCTNTLAGRVVQRRYSFWALELNAVNGG